MPNYFIYFIWTKIDKYKYIVKKHIYSFILYKLHTVKVKIILKTTFSDILEYKINEFKVMECEPGSGAARL